MSRSASTAVENNFVNGWITEATGLNFPENAVTATDNYIYTVTGKVYRRNGINLESGYTFWSVPSDDSAIYTEFLWQSVAGDGNKSFLVQQVGSELRFFSVGDTEALSTNYDFSTDLYTYSLVDLVTFQSKPVQFAAGYGRLLVTHPNMDPLFITYSAATDSITVDRITIRTRDVVGVPGPPRGRSTSVNANQYYDLRNQGWPGVYIQEFFDKSGGLFPSDYDVWWLYKTPDALGNEIFLTDLAVSGGILNNIDRGNSPAPKGSIILNEFYQDRAQWSNGSMDVITSGVNRPSCVAFFAGRSFFAGTQAQNYNSKIYFSQIIESVEQFGECFQVNDPTSQYSSDLLPSDGGSITIPEVGTVIKLWVLDGSLIVFASNGLWQITGSQGIGFSANDYTVKKISKQEVLSSLSFVDVRGVPMWWSTDGIYTLLTDNVGSLNVKSLTEQRIKSYYQELPAQIKFYAKGAFNLKNSVVQWVYRENAGVSVKDNQDYTRILNFNIDTQAFYPFSVNNNYTSIKGIFSVQGFGSSAQTTNVTTNDSELVFTELGDIVQTITAVSVPVTAVFKYTVTFNPDRTSMTFSEQRDVNYLDWASVQEAGGGIDAFASFDSGYKVRGQAQNKFQSNYVVIYCENEINTAFDFQGKWNYSTSGDTGRWSMLQRVTMPGQEYTYNSRRLKVRGHGLALQYHVNSVPLSPCTLIGWSVWDTTNGSL